jgi:hypothetical protein
MLVELERYRSADDDGERPAGHRNVTVNPGFVSAVFPSDSYDDVTIVRGPDGRGFLVKGNYTEVMAKLNGRDDNVLELGSRRPQSEN